MREEIVMRLDCKGARRLLQPKQYRSLGEGTCEARLPLDDPAIPMIIELHERYRQRDDLFVSSSWIERSYSTSELQRSRLLLIRRMPYFEPSGEECGTRYDYEDACPDCHAGRKQLTPLFLDTRKIPKSAHLARTFGNEIVVSQELADLFWSSKVEGIDLRDVIHHTHPEDDPINPTKYAAGRRLIESARRVGAVFPSLQYYRFINSAEGRALYEEVYREHAERINRSLRRRGRPGRRWYQLLVTARPLKLTPKNRTGISPLQPDVESKYVCPRGDTVGLKLLSEPQVDFSGYDGGDFVESIQYISARIGLYYPERLLMISQKVYAILRSVKAPRIKVEVVREDRDSTTLAGPLTTKPTS